jgi:hypothetical protein
MTIRDHVPVNQTSESSFEIEPETAQIRDRECPPRLNPNERLSRSALWRAIRDCLSDAAVVNASPRLRICAAQDAAVLTAVLVADLHGIRVERRDRANAFAYLRSSFVACPGVSCHAARLARFDRNEFVGSVCWTRADADMALLSARRLHTLLRWMLRVAEPDDQLDRWTA